MAGKRRKTRTHVSSNKKSKTGTSTTPAAAGAASSAGVVAKTPKSFVVKSGEVGRSIQTLVRDMRALLEPNTATRLRERAGNKLLDYITMAGPLGVSHMLIFTRTETNVNMKIAKTPKGPTFHFHIERYSLRQDIQNASRKAVSLGKESNSSPLLVMNQFPNDDEHKHLRLLTSMMQSLFPPIQVQTMALSQARRLVLLSYNKATRTIDWRHYLISVRPTGVSRRVRKITNISSTNKIPDLSSAQDVAEYMLGTMTPGEGYQTGSDTEAETDAEGEEEAGTSKRIVELAQNYAGRNSRKGEKRAIRLREIGPRMELRLIKITEGLGGSQGKKTQGSGEGEVLFHEYMHKSPKEVAAIKKANAAKKAEATRRRKEQEANVARKEAKKNAKLERRAARRAAQAEGVQGGENQDDAQDSESEAESDESDNENDDLSDAHLSDDLEEDDDAMAVEEEQEQGEVETAIDHEDEADEFAFEDRVFEPIKKK